MNLSLPAADISIGHHVQRSFLGLTFNLDTIWTTVLAGAIVVGLLLIVSRNATSGVPGKLQVAWEMLVDGISRQVNDNIGRPDRVVIQLAISLFAFILIANWLELIPSGDDPHILPAPTADVNLTYALGLLVIVGTHVRGVRSKGAKGYFKHYFQPYPIFFPINLIEEIVKPFTLALRLFGNIFAGGIMIALIGLFPIYVFWIPTILWKGFDFLIALLQAFIFALLTILYFGTASESHPDEDTALLETEAREEDTDGSGRSGAAGHATVALPERESQTAGAP